ncbi:MAG: 50S ribosomal protein L35 [Candidatus Acidiferrum sp.]
MTSQVPLAQEKVFAMPRNASKPKLKLKTHRGARKRFKITATGKIKRMHSGKRHLLGTKKPGRMRKLKKLTLVSKADMLKTKQMLPYG